MLAGRPPFAVLDRTRLGVIHTQEFSSNVEGHVHVLLLTTRDPEDAAD